MHFFKDRVHNKYIHNKEQEINHFKRQQKLGVPQGFPETPQDLSLDDQLRFIKKFLNTYETSYSLTMKINPEISEVYSSTVSLQSIPTVL